jgi:5'-3' exoribonuclease 2
LENPKIPKVQLVEHLISGESTSAQQRAAAGMGVPAFYRWLSEKYPKIVVDVLEERPARVQGIPIPIDITAPNPNGIEFDNLYVDMNGIIHPCAHPESGPQPSSEEEMYVNVMNYVDR